MIELLDTFPEKCGFIFLFIRSIYELVLCASTISRWFFEFRSNGEIEDTSEFFSLFKENSFDRTSIERSHNFRERERLMWLMLSELSNEFEASVLGIDNRSSHSQTFYLRRHEKNRYERQSATWHRLFVFFWNCSSFHFAQASTMKISSRTLPELRRVSQDPSPVNLRLRNLPANRKSIRQRTPCVNPARPSKIASLFRVICNLFTKKIKIIEKSRVKIGYVIVSLNYRQFPIAVDTIVHAVCTGWAKLILLLFWQNVKM